MKVYYKLLNIILIINDTSIISKEFVLYQVIKYKYINIIRNM